MAEGLKKEFRIDSSDSARPQVTIQDEPRYFSNIKPKKRHLVDVIYEETGEYTKTKVGQPVQIILKTCVYNDGVITEQTVGDQNEGYQTFLRTGQAIPSVDPNVVRDRPLSKKVKDAIAKAQKANAAVEAKADKE